jgi:hypothetical protein
MRHAPPITMPGLFTDQEELHNARIAAQLADEGIDERKRESDEERRFHTLGARIRALTETRGTQWPMPTPHEFTLNTFILVAQMLSDDTAVDNLMGDIEKHFRARIINNARVWMEIPMPHQRNVVIQFLCDWSNLPTKVAPTIIVK